MPAGPGSHMMRLEDRNALVTGASRGIGRATALALAASGANVVVNYLRAVDSAEQVADDIRRAGRQAVAVQADIRNPDDVARLAAVSREQFGHIDILVNNAGIVRDNLVTFMKDEEWTDVVDTNLKGAFYCTKLIGKDMVRRKAGRIVNVASDAGLLGDVMRANYSAAKAGLIGLTKAVAREFAGCGVNVNAVAPGIVETEMISGLRGSKRDRRLEQIPMARFGAADEVARVVVFLASDEAAYITGQVVCVDGGLRM